MDDQYVRLYFRLGFTQSEILLCLALNHGIYISERHLRRKLREMGLYRRKNFTNEEIVLEFIQQQISTHGQLHGYRWMHLKCLLNGISVTQRTVLNILREVDPEGIDFRRRRRLRRRQYYSKGPNYIWHLDCYDKLKRYGICINGCIDGYSRHIIWLEAGNNTSNPAIIGGHFIRMVELLNGCPHTVRADRGTENGLVEDMQLLLRSDTEKEHALPPFLYGTSPANQRIEAWWSILRKQHAQFWINFFQNLTERGLFAGSYLDKGLVQFCFLKIIQEELEQVVHQWNLHVIRRNRNSIGPMGRPFIMFNFPEIYGSKDCLQRVTSADINICKEACLESQIPCDEDIYELAHIIMNEEQLQMAKTADDALNLYITLRIHILGLLNLH